MYNSINEKVRAVYDYLKDTLEVRSIADFAAKIKRNRSNISEILSGRGAVTEQLVLDIVQRFPYINDLFLTDLDCEQMLLGQGDTLTNVTNVNFKSPSATINAPDPELIKSLRAEIVRLNDQIVWMRSLIDKLSGR